MVILMTKRVRIKAMIGNNLHNCIMHKYCLHLYSTIRNEVGLTPIMNHDKACTYNITVMIGQRLMPWFAYHFTLLVRWSWSRSQNNLRANHRWCIKWIVGVLCHLLFAWSKVFDLFAYCIRISVCKAGAVVTISEE